jgi:hypothetical protein
MPVMIGMRTLSAWLLLQAGPIIFILPPRFMFPLSGRSGSLQEVVPGYIVDPSNVEGVSMSKKLQSDNWWLDESEPEIVKAFCSPTIH